MECVEIRQVQNRSELEACYDLWSLVFPTETRHFFQERLDLDSSYSFETTWIAKVDNVIASAIQIFPYSCWLDQVIVRAGGIGNVATHPKYRGKGLAQEILHAASEWMITNGYSISLLLTGIHSFYEQVGWRKVVESIYKFNTGAIQTLAFKDIHHYRFAKMHEDLKSIQEIYDSFNKVRTNSSIRTRDYWMDQIKWRRESGENFFVAVVDDTPTAYLRLHEANGKIVVTEACYTHDRNQMRQLFEQFCLLVPHRNIEIRIPNDHVLNMLFRDHKIKADEYDNCMWRVLDWPKLMKRMENTFSRRIAQLEYVQPRDVLLHSKNGTVLVNISTNKQVNVYSASGERSYNERFVVTEGELLTLLFQGSDYVSNRQLRDSDTIRMLFPKQGSIMWSTDFF
ncbi:GNAT family N-acetyltransferase [Alicyclobacillus ferrooxydans]|uniref:N-acetyltransferase domain-containing protein n=1 Tax=Alicyclobacillus ferrooxydans TaxID=471514 RepID=A0A0P9EXT6_9BACL|nr:GNAT family N-acetyltransferase [Alicyclobacillus ferrooxydans]KPV43939.1 hypothetical protein AN477_09440 [Alicyclobacillus ferrooxydans]